VVKKAKHVIHTTKKGIKNNVNSSTAAFVGIALIAALVALFYFLIVPK